MKKTIEEKLYARKTKNPPALYNLLGGVWKMLFTKKYNISVEYKCDPRKDKRGQIMLSNHTSRMDYIFNAIPLLPKRYNFVAGYNEFYRSHLAGIFKLFGVIPKKNFVADSYTVKEILRVAKRNGRIFLFPEGMNSIRGYNQPVAVATGKLIKLLGLPVYYSVIKGGYMTCPKHASDERCGKVEVVYDKMFEPEDLEKLTADEIQSIINEKLWHDDFAWNAEKGYKYNNAGRAAKDLHDLLYVCPKCGSEFTMEGKGDVIRCKHCGNGASVDQTYAFHPLDASCVIPATQTEWTKLQRERVRKEIEDENFSFSADVRLGMLPKYKLLKHKKTSEIVGSGKLTISANGLTYDGTKNGEPFTFNIPCKNLPTYGMCTEMKQFYTFLNGEFMEFFPSSACVEKFFLATEELHRKLGGKWQDAYTDKF
ncbi:MAG: 1-acyl-sn-glycerol-3-phosphate acyltransferase [Clostridiales bacterium]|nr:1-acyl-sn-glycerol-3-phosphate acyltransferase [Clostridiales bacterium]